jgi:hypothetical protein
MNNLALVLRCQSKYEQAEGRLVRTSAAGYDAGQRRRVRRLIGTGFGALFTPIKNAV